MMNCPMMAGQTQQGGMGPMTHGPIRECGFAWHISPMSVCSSGETFGLPTGLRDRQRQYARNPARCLRMMVSGLTIAIAARTEGNQAKQTENDRYC